MQTENAYIETDLGNIALNPRGEYSDETSYEYLDTVSYMGGSYMCLAELTKNINGIAPESGENTQYWQMLTLPGQLTPGAIAMHDDIVNKSKQVETSRAAVELSQQAVEDAQVDVRQMRQDTQEASESAIASRDAAAGYAQAAEASRTAAAESEQNINAQVNNFNTHVSEKTSVAEASIEEARKKAIDAVTTQQDLSIKAVTDEETRQTNAAIKAVTTQQNNSVQAIADEASEQIKKIKDSLDKGLSEEGKAADAKATGDAISVLKEDLSNKITKFYASNQGETHLADSDNGKIMDMMLYGKSEQKQYSGKNLLELSDNQVQSENLKIQINQGIITFSGTVNTEAFVREIDSFTVPSDGTYTISTNSNSNKDSPRILFLINDNPQYGSAFNGTAKELNAGDVVRLYIRISSTGSYDGVTIKPMIEKGSKVTSYEPYTGGQPSPSPDYPQEIKSVVNPIVKVYGKNMMPYPKDNTIRRNGVTLTVKDGKYTLVGKPTTSTWLNIYPQVLDSTSSNMLSEKPLPTKGKKISMINGSNGYSLNFRKVSNGDKVFGIEYNDAKLADEDSNGVFLYIYKTDKTYNDTFEIMISDPADTTSTVFEPYTEQEVSLPYTLNAIPVNSGGNVTINGQQYVSDYIDVERGKVVRCVKREPLSKNGRLSSNSDPFYTYNLPSAKPKTITEVFVLCNLAQFNSITTSNSQIGISSDGSNSLRMRLDGYATLEQYTRLSAEIIYELATPIEEDLTSEQIQSLQALKTKHPVTNIFITSDQLDGCTTFNYPISMANGWNYVKKQLSDNRDYIYDMDTTSAEAYVNSEYAVALTELEV